MEKIQDPVVFSVNGSRIVSEDKHPSFIEYNEDRPLFPYVSFEKENSVLAKVYKTISVTSPSSGERGRGGGGMKISVTRGPPF